jgi:hypothetical protein
MVAKIHRAVNEAGTQFDRCAFECVGMNTATDSVPGLKYEMGYVAAAEEVGGPDASRSGSDDDDLVVARLHKFFYHQPKLERVDNQGMQSFIRR